MYGRNSYTVDKCRKYLFMKNAIFNATSASPKKIGPAGLNLGPPSARSSGGAPPASGRGPPGLRPGGKHWSKLWPGRTGHLQYSYEYIKNRNRGCSDYTINVQQGV